jgi:uncharacterized protein (DUF2225 family)
MAFKQVVINILVAAGIVSEKDFNESVNHFKEVLTNEFAKRMLETLKQEQLTTKKPESKIIPIEEDDFENEDDDFDWDDDRPVGKA